MTGAPGEQPGGRWAVVMAGYRAVPPPGVAAAPYQQACLTDSYEVLAGLAGIRAGLVGRAAELDEIRWPQDPVIEGDGRSLRPVADRISHDFGPARPTELIMVAGDVPDLPELIIAKIAKALHRADVALAPEIGGDGLVAVGVRLPWPAWLPDDLELDSDPSEDLVDRAPRRGSHASTPGWHRMRRPEAVHRLDPGLEGWDNVRLLLSGAG